MTFLAIRNWRRYQHYKDRRPIWVKFYVDLLYDDTIKALPITTRFVWDQLLLLAGEYENAIPNDPELIGKLLRVPKGTCREAIAQLLKGRWLQEKQTKRSAIKAASKVASPRARPRVRGETEREVETPPTPPKSGGANGVTNITAKQLRVYTGWRRAASKTAEHYVRDPLGKDKPPSTYPDAKPTREEVLAALAGIHGKDWEGEEPT